MAGVFMFSTSTIVLRTSFVPRWTAFFGYSWGALLLLSTGVIRWTPLVFPMWLLLISVAILFENASDVAELPGTEHISRRVDA